MNEPKYCEGNSRRSGDQHPTSDTASFACPNNPELDHRKYQTATTTQTSFESSPRMNKVVEKDVQLIGEESAAVALPSHTLQSLHARPNPAAFAAIYTQVLRVRVLPAKLDIAICTWHSEE
jgi:hypothetical protein